MSTHLTSPTSPAPGRFGVAATTLTVLLAALTLGAWAQAFFGADAALRIGNRSGGVVSRLQVCLPGGECLERASLWPHESWRVPLPEGVTRAEVSVQGQGQRQAQGQSVSLDSGRPAQLIVTQGGQIEQQ
ncbi:hypothetical protein GCM10008959_09730 [Deinococcus seoulensis]|uniref:Uncharacterized protein n=2 Tax=Deinococcus TaxID=1298 RepID=A0ABQ2RRX5_9DEIO|nr:MULTISPECIES: hypothetical protein [Deinococcus]GGR50526.1 hypothetical protein GCM10008959_09730 [Deinococcus seoulensis]GGS32100.1 hypothetical protein GCM10008961_24800 [Deinococcus knuensis]